MAQFHSDIKQPSNTMKALVICILFSTAFAKPATLDEHSHRFETIEDIPDVDLDTNIREKKAPALTQVKNSHHAENFHLTDDDSHGINPAEERSVLGPKKPIIVKKRVGYRVYRDSDEELAQADPKEKCQKQVKVKLCEDEAESSSQRRDSDSTLDAKQDHMSEKEIKHSIEMAKEAVEHLQRDLQVIRSSSANQEQTIRPSSDSVLHEDIEVARQVLEHIHSNFGNLQSMRLHATTLNNEDLSNIGAEKKRMTQWKDTLGQENTNSLRNIEDRFKTNDHHDDDDDVKVEKMLNDVDEKDTQERNTAAENIETTTNNKDRESETSMTQDIQSKTKLHSDNLTMLPTTDTNTLKEATHRDSSSRNINDHETNTMKVKEEEMDNHHTNTEIAEKNLNQFRANKDFENQNEMETHTSNKVNTVTDSKNEQMRHTLTEDPKKTNAMTPEKIPLHNKDRSVGGATGNEDMLQQQINEPLKTNTANENIDQGSNNLKSAEASEQIKATPMSLKDQSDSIKTHKTTQHKLLGLLNTARTSDETTGMAIPSTNEQDITRMNSNSRDSITTNIQTADFHAPTFHKTDDQFNAASEHMNMRWGQDNHNAHFQQMRNEDLSQHAFRAPSNDHFNMQPMRNSQLTGAMNTEHHAHHLMDDHFVHEFDKEPRLRAEVMRANSNTHSHHDFSHHPQRLTSEVAPVHGMAHKTSHADSEVQASNHMDTMHRSAAEYAQQWFSRGMYREAQPSPVLPSYGSPGAVGYFPNAKTGGCAIPLLLSCSPSVVSGTLAKSQPSYSAPSSYDYRYHNKRETKHLIGKLAKKSDSTSALGKNIKSTTNDMH